MVFLDLRAKNGKKCVQTINCSRPTRVLLWVPFLLVFPGPLMQVWKVCSESGRCAYGMGVGMGVGGKTVRKQCGGRG